jgi:hypothetical protein
MSKKVYLVETYDCDYKVFENFMDAVKYAVTEIEKSSDPEEDKLHQYKELICSITDRDVDKWGYGYTLDEFIWCWEVDYFTSYGKDKE